MKRFLSLLLLTVMVLSCAAVFSSCKKKGGDDDVLAARLFGDDGLLLVKKGDKWGFINKKGKVIVPCELYYAEPFVNGVAIVYETDFTSCYYINKKGDRLFDRSFYRATEFDDNERAVVIQTNGGSSELIDRNGEAIFTAKSIGRNWNGKYLFTNDEGRMGVVDLNGNIVLEPVYDCLYLISKFETNEQGKTTENGVMGDRLFAECTDEDTGNGVLCMIDSAGNILCSDEYELNFAIFSGDVALVRKTKLDDFNIVYYYTLIDRDGRSVVDELQVNEVAEIRPGYLAFSVGNVSVWSGNHDQFVLYDWSGNMILDLRGSGYYPIASSFGENEFVVKDRETNKYGMLDLRGETVIPCEFDEVILPDANGCAVCKKGGTFYVINRKGETVFEKTCDDLTTSDNFSGEYYLACYKDGEKETYELLDTTGETVRTFGSEYSFGNFEQVAGSGETYFDLDYYCRNYADGYFVVRDAESNKILVLNHKFKPVKAIKSASYDAIRLPDVFN